MDRSKSFDSDISDTNNLMIQKPHSISSKLPSKHFSTPVDIKQKPILNSQRSVIASGFKKAKSKRKEKCKSTTELGIKPPADDTDQGYGGFFSFLPSLSLLNFRKKSEENNIDEKQTDDANETKANKSSRVKENLITGDCLSDLKTSSNHGKKREDCFEDKNTVHNQKQTSRSCLKPAGRSLSTPTTKLTPVKRDFTVRFGSETRKTFERTRIKRATETNSKMTSIYSNSKSLPNVDRSYFRHDESSVDGSSQNKNRNLYNNSKAIKTKKDINTGEVVNDDSNKHDWTAKHDWTSKESAVDHKRIERRKQAEQIHIDRLNKLKLQKIEEKRAENLGFGKDEPTSKKFYKKYSTVNKESDEKRKIKKEDTKPIVEDVENKPTVPKDTAKPTVTESIQKRSNIDNKSNIPGNLSSTKPENLLTTEESNDESTHLENNPQCIETDNRPSPLGPNLPQIPETDYESAPSKVDLPLTPVPLTASETDMDSNVDTSPSLPSPSPPPLCGVEASRQSFVNDSGQVHIYIEEVNVKRFKNDQTDRFISGNTSQAATSFSNPRSHYVTYSKETPFTSLTNPEKRISDLDPPLDDNNPLVNEVTKLLRGNNNQMIEPELMSSTARSVPAAEHAKQSYNFSNTATKRKCNLSINKDPNIVGMSLPKKKIDKTKQNSRAVQQLQCTVITSPKPVVTKKTENPSVSQASGTSDVHLIYSQDSSSGQTDGSINSLGYANRHQENEDLRGEIDHANEDRKSQENRNLKNEIGLDDKHGELQAYQDTKDEIADAEEHREKVMSIKCDQDGCVEELVEQKEVVKNILSSGSEDCSSHSDGSPTMNKSSDSKNKNKDQGHNICRQRLGGNSIFERFLNEKEYHVKNDNNDICLGNPSLKPVKSKDEKAVVYANTGSKKTTNTPGPQNKTDKHDLKEYLIFDDRQMQKKELHGYRQGLKNESKQLQEQIGGLDCINAEKNKSKTQKPKAVNHDMKTPSFNQLDIRDGHESNRKQKSVTRFRTVVCSSGDASPHYDAETVSHIDRSILAIKSTNPTDRENFGDKLATLGQNVVENIGSVIGAVGDSVEDVKTAIENINMKSDSDGEPAKRLKKDLPTFEEIGEGVVENVGSFIGAVGDTVVSTITDENAVGKAKKELPTFEEISEGVGYRMGEACGKLRDVAEENYPYVKDIAESSMHTMKNFVSETVPKHLETVKEVVGEKLPVIQDSLSSTMESARESCNDLVMRSSNLSLGTSESQFESDSDISRDDYTSVQDSKLQSSDSTSESDGYVKSYNPFRTLSNHIIDSISSTFSRTSVKDKSPKAAVRETSPIPERVKGLIDNINKRVQHIERAQKEKQDKKLLGIRKKVAKMDDHTLKSIRRVYTSPPRAQENVDIDRKLKRDHKENSIGEMEISPIQTKFRSCMDKAKHLATGDTVSKDDSRSSSKYENSKHSNGELGNRKTLDKQKSPFREKLDDYVEKIKNVFTIEDVISPKGKTYRRISTTSVHEDILPLPKSKKESLGSCDLSSFDDPTTSNLSSSFCDSDSISSSYNRESDSSLRSVRNKRSDSKKSASRSSGYSGRRTESNMKTEPENTAFANYNLWQLGSEVIDRLQSLTGKDNAKDISESINHNATPQTSYMKLLSKSKRLKMDSEKRSKLATEHLDHLNQEYGDIGGGTVINCNHVIINPFAYKKDDTCMRKSSYENIKRNAWVDDRFPTRSSRNVSYSNTRLTKSNENVFSSSSQSVNALESSYNSHPKPIASKSMIGYISDNVSDMMTYDKDGYPKKELFGFRRKWADTFREAKAWLVDEKVPVSTKETDDDLNSFSSILNDDSSDDEGDDDDDEDDDDDDGNCRVPIVSHTHIL